MTHMRISFDNLFPHVAPGGVYFIEDIGDAVEGHVQEEQKKNLSGQLHKSKTVLDQLKETVLLLRGSRDLGVAVVECRRAICAIGKHMGKHASPGGTRRGARSASPSPRLSLRGRKRGDSPP